MNENNEAKACCEERTNTTVCDRPFERIPTPLREIRITPLNYGFVVNIGCQSFAMEDRLMMIEKLNAYLENPAIAQENWLQRKVLP